MCNVEPASGGIYCDRVGIFVAWYSRRGERRERAGRGVHMKFADGPSAVIRDVSKRVGSWCVLEVRSMQRSAQNCSYNARDAKQERARDMDHFPAERAHITPQHARRTGVG